MAWHGTDELWPKKKNWFRKIRIEIFNSRNGGKRWAACLYSSLSLLSVDLGSEVMHKALKVQYGGWRWEWVNGAVDSNFVLIGARSGSESNHCAVGRTCSIAGILVAWQVEILCIVTNSIDWVIAGWSVHHPRCSLYVGCTDTNPSGEKRGIS